MRRLDWADDDDDEVDEDDEDDYLVKGTWAAAATVMWWLGGEMAFLPLVIDTTRMFRAREIALDNTC